MILRTVLTTLFVIHYALVFSQFSFGLKGGFNYTNQRTIDTRDQFTSIGDSKWLPTFHIGFFGKHKVAERSSIIWEVQYSEKGSGEQHLAYLTTPLLFQYRIYKKLSIDAGAEFGVLLFTYWKNSEINGNNAFFRKADVGLSGGIQYDISDRFGVGIRYTHGLANVLNKDYTVTGFGDGFSTTFNFYEYGLRIRNQALQLSIGYRFSKTKKEEK